MLCAALLPLLSFAQVPPAPLPPIDSLTDWQVNVLVQQYAAQAQVFEQVLSEKSTAATTRRVNKEEALQMVKLDSTFSKSDQDSIANLLKIFKKEEKAAAKQQRQAANVLKSADKIVASDNVVKRKKLPKLWKEIYKTSELIYPPEKITSEEKVKEKAPKPAKKTNKKKDEPATTVEEGADIPVEAAIPINITPPAPKNPPTSAPTRKYDPAADVMLNPPTLPCRLSVDTRDEFSGERYRRTVPVELFRNAPAALKAFLQGKPNVQCDAALISSGANAFLDLTFIINDPNPRKSFGKIEKGSLATLKFMDGSSYNLSTQQTSEIVQNQETQVSVCSAQYPLSADALKKIKRSELDKIRIAWSSGYEDYDVQYVLLLMEQVKCLFE